MIKLNKGKVGFGLFPNGEYNLPVTNLKVRPMNQIEWIYESDVEFFQLALLKDYLDSIMKMSQLTVYYFPHSRMDRDNGTYAMSLKTAAKLVNNMNFVSVSIWEPHSDVTPALLNMCYVYDWCQDNMYNVIQMCGADSVFFPDAGAAKRYATDIPYAIGIKKRDFATGDILEFDYHGDIGERVLIVDDLCSKGGTFIASTNMLRGKGVKEVYLMVAHTERTMYYGNLLKTIDGIYVPDYNDIWLSDGMKIKVVKQ